MYHNHLRIKKDHTIPSASLHPFVVIALRNRGLFHRHHRPFSPKVLPFSFHFVATNAEFLYGALICIMM